jgi:hypothetical protein
LLSAAAASEHDLMQGRWRKEIAAVEQLCGDFSGALKNNLSVGEHKGAGETGLPFQSLRPFRQKLHCITY